MCLHLVLLNCTWILLLDTTIIVMDTVVCFNDAIRCQSVCCVSSRFNTRSCPVCETVFNYMFIKYINSCAYFQFTLMAFMIEGSSSKTNSKVMKWLYVHPNDSHRLLQLLCDVTINYLIEQVKAGAQVHRII